MTAYNREIHLEAIESVIASTYQNWELIIVDDQQRPNSRNCKKFKAIDKRIKACINERNLGDYQIETAAGYAQGKYLKYVDADDMIYPYGLEQLVLYGQFPEAGYGLCSLDQDKDLIYPSTNSISGLLQTLF